MARRETATADPAQEGEGAEAAAAVMAPDEPGAGEELLESLMETDLYSMGAFFSDRHPELVEEVIASSEDIEEQGLRGYAEGQDLSIEECFHTLLTGLAVRYYKAVAL